MYQTPNVIPQNTGASGVIYIDDSLWQAQTITQAQEMCTKVLEVFQKA